MIDTKELINRVKPDMDINKYLDTYKDEFLNVTHTELLNEYLAKRDMKISEVVKKSGQGEYVYKVFNGERKPSRDVLIGMAVGMKLSLEETQLLLRVAKFAALDPRNIRDSIIIFGIKSEYEIERINELLYEKEQKEL